jgi:hypothetical protein
MACTNVASWSLRAEISRNVVGYEGLVLKAWSLARRGSSSETRMSYMVG